MRLTSGFWVAAYVARLRLAGMPAYVMARGDDTAGAVLVKVATLDGQARGYERQFDLGTDARVWREVLAGAEADVDVGIARRRAVDRDLWVIEIEDRAGRSLLDEDGLGG